MAEQTVTREQALANINRDIDLAEQRVEIAQEEIQRWESKRVAAAETVGVLAEERNPQLEQAVLRARQRQEIAEQQSYRWNQEKSYAETNIAALSDLRQRRLAEGASFTG